ncbi:MAG TPA: hypothetical protein VHD37_00020 [Candidatus Paceibacterota bacterium]|nr:hypothetical protein [Candidatus Paceibacterota bacterium]
MLSCSISARFPGLIWRDSSVDTRKISIALQISSRVPPLWLPPPPKKATAVVPGIMQGAVAWGPTAVTSGTDVTRTWLGEVELKFACMSIALPPLFAPAEAPAPA